jgi:hypothetical protein
MELFILTKKDHFYIIEDIKMYDIKHTTLTMCVVRSYGIADSIVPCIDWRYARYWWYFD